MAGGSWSVDSEHEEQTESQVKLLKVLAGLSESAAFCAFGEVDSVLPGLQVEGVGEIGVPVSATEVKRIIKAASQAPYGRGEKTIVDTKVRKVWQLEPDQFHFENKQWVSLIDKIVKQVRAEFGLKQKITTELYKLLIYEKGGFFLPHRDTEKAHGMFATLIVCLPSKHAGGKLIVSHSGQRMDVDFARQSKFATQFASFYADCEHEVKPVTSGYRICVVYNLSVARVRRQLLAPEFGDEIESVTSSLARIFAEDDERNLLVLPLAHQYTEAGLTDASLDDRDERVAESFNDDDWEDDDWDEEHDADDRANSYWADNELDEADEAAATLKKVQELLEESKKAVSSKRKQRGRRKSFGGESQSLSASLQLKGADRARVEVLKQAATKSDCRAYIALLTHWQSGYPDYGTIEHDYGYGRYGQGYDISDGNQGAEFEEVFDESMKLTHWHDLSGRRQSFKELHIDETDVLSDVAPEDRPHRQELHEATGNAGVSMERWYHQAIVVLWPASRHFYVLASQGPENAVPELANMLAATGRRAGLNDCRQFARAIINNWVNTNQYGNLNQRVVNISDEFVRALVEISDTRLAIDFFKRVLPQDYAGLDGSPLVQLAELAGWLKIKPALVSLYKSQKPGDYHANLAGLVRLFHSLCCGGDARLSSERKVTCLSLIDSVEKAIDRWDKSRRRSWQLERSDRSGIVEPMLRALCEIGAKEHVARFLQKICSDEKRYDVHKVLIPAVAGLMVDENFSGASAPKLSQSTLKKLRKPCIEELRRRTQSRPQPPADWKRSAKLGCNCDDCKELGRFLRNRTEKVLRFPRRKDLRQHLHQQIDSNRIDCTHVTEREGRPYTLVCTKTQATHDRDLRQYDTNLKLLAELGG